MLGMFRRKSSPSLSLVSVLPHRLYILPTYLGFFWGLIVFSLLIVALAKQEWVATGVLFWPNMIALVMLWQTNASLKNIQLNQIFIRPVCLGERAELVCWVESKAWPLTLQMELEESYQEGPPTTVVLEPGVPQQVRLTFLPKERGLHFVPKIGISTIYPQGIAQVWTWWVPLVRYWVYAKPLKASQNSTLGQTSDQKGWRGEEFQGLRPYRRGDDRHDIAWKASARIDGLLTRERPQQPKVEETWLDWDQVPGSVEEKCGRLTERVLSLEFLKKPYGLKLPHQTLQVALGGAHRHACLSALSLMGKAMPTPPVITSGRSRWWLERMMAWGHAPPLVIQDSQGHGVMSHPEPYDLHAKPMSRIHRDIEYILASQKNGSTSKDDVSKVQGPSSSTSSSNTPSSERTR